MLSVYNNYFRIARDSDTKRCREGLKRPFCPASGLEFFRVPANVAAYLEPPEGEGANQVAPSLTLIGLHSDQFSPHSFESSRDTCAAARGNQVPAGVEYFQVDAVGELVRVPV